MEEMILLPEMDLSPLLHPSGILGLWIMQLMGIISLLLALPMVEIPLPLIVPPLTSFETLHLTVINF